MISSAISVAWAGGTLREKGIRMNAKKIRKIQERIDRARGQSGVKPTEIEGIAKLLKRKPSGKGKHPQWISQLLPHQPPISIPHHNSLNKFTAAQILDQLEQDLLKLIELGEDNESTETY